MSGTRIKHYGWLEEFNFSNCLLNRSEYGHFIADYITEEQEGFVLNLNGTWGSGKTQFLKRLYTLLHDRKHPTIYIDAWESDFTKEPLTVVSSELLSQLEKYSSVTGSDFDTVKALIGKFIKGTAIAASGYVSKELLNDSATGIEVVKSLFEKTDADYITSIQKGYTEQIDAIKEIRIKLSVLAEVIEKNQAQKLPIIVLVDELDRCRPDYAIEMLEVIKHFFDTKHFVFVVATDTNQLCSSVKAIYGNEFDSEKYLKRFFHRKALLPEPELKYYIEAMGLQREIEKLQPKLILYPTMQNGSLEVTDSIALVARAYNLDIRTTDQLVAKFLSCLRTAKRAEKKQVISVITLLVALVEFDINCPSYKSRKGHYQGVGAYVGCSVIDDFVLDCSGYTTNVSELIDLLLESSSLTLINEDGYSRMQPLSSNRVRSKIDVGYGNLEKRNDTLYHVCTDLLTVLNTYAYSDRCGNGDESPKYWLWDDYKKVVELAGYID